MKLLNVTCSSLTVKEMSINPHYITRIETTSKDPEDGCCIIMCNGSIMVSETIEELERRIERC